MSSNTLDSALRALANRWVLKARDYARDAKAATDPATAAGLRASAETYNRAAMELAEVLKQGSGARATGTMPAAAPSASVATMEAPAAPTPSYANLSVGEVIRMLEYAGVSARDVILNKDNSFTAVFSRWQPLSEAERLALIKAMDLRLVVLGTGKTRDTSDPTVDFAFKA